MLTQLSALTNLLQPIGYLLFFGGAFYLIYSLLPPQKEREIRKRLEDGEIVMGEGAKFIRLFRPIFQLFLPLIAKLPFDNYRNKIEKYAITAGIEKEVTGDEFIGFQITTSILFAGIAFGVFHNVFYCIIGAVLGLGYPYLWLYEKRKVRQEEILGGMPDVIDMLSLSVEAGLEFNSGINKVCDIYLKDKAPFVMELYRMSQNMKLGRTREDALRDMAERVDIPQVYAFTSILIQADKMGTSIAEILKSQAVRMRQERFMRAERLGARATQKLLIPMIIFVFPVIFIIILAPYMIKYIFN
ncbi:type II secretion system F family protein [Desulfococcaceae bacterium HSG7]|nr:type II secretion system F family protein [Desulfococcaceae bacterium HSG7]